MNLLLIESKNKINLSQKTPVFFTCHPADFDTHFRKICDDMFKTHDCAVLYTLDRNERIDKEQQESDLARCRLFVVPVTAISTGNSSASVTRCLRWHAACSAPTAANRRSRYSATCKSR